MRTVLQGIICPLALRAATTEPALPGWHGEGGEGEVQTLACSRHLETVMRKTGEVESWLGLLFSLQGTNLQKRDL